MGEQELRPHRCCFTGHRPDKLPIGEEQLCRLLDGAIAQAVQDGFTTFISGMAPGVDICAAELVLRRRASDPRLRLICALPFRDFGMHWKNGWTQRFLAVLRQADLVYHVNKTDFFQEAYQLRNQWMVDHSARVIAVYSGCGGGTRNTIQYAQRCQVPVHILNPARPDLGGIPSPTP